MKKEKTNKIIGACVIVVGVIACLFSGLSTFGVVVGVLAIIAGLQIMFMRITQWF